jgi:hypothetical protein
MNYIPSNDQIAAQLRLLLPALGAVLTTFGLTKEAGYATTALLVAGPLSIIIGMIWSLVANTRKAIMSRAAKPKDANTPEPQIILPAQEKALADSLPNNVTSTPMAK